MTKFMLVLIAVAATCIQCTRGGHGSGNSDEIEATLPSGEKLRLSKSETLRVNLLSEPPTLDWHKATDTTSTNLIGNLMEGLTQYDVRTNSASTSGGAPKLVPGLALKWEPLPGGFKWKFTLRQGVVWSDGVPFTAQHVLDGWRRALAKETVGADAHFLFALKNARDFNAGKKEWSEVGAKITAPFEVTVELERPMSFFPFLFRSVTTFPVRLDLIEKYGDHWTDPGKLVTLGAFRLKAWTHDKLLVLERNDTYYGEKPSLKYVAGYMIQEQATSLNLYESGKLDSLHNLPSVEMARLRSRPDYHDVPMLRVYFYGFNVTKPPTDQPLVRRAIAMAINRDEIVKVLAGGEKPQTAWIPPGLIGNDGPRGAAVGLKFDPEKARALLKEAGYGEGAKKLPKIDLKFNTNEDHQRVAEIVQSQLKKNLGVELELKNEEWKVYLSSLKTQPPNLFRLGWQAGYADPDDFMNVMLSYSENNRTQWKNSKYDALVLSAAALSMPGERARLYEQAEKILLEEDAAIIPIFTAVGHYLLSPRVENYPANSVEALLYKHVTLKPAAKQ